jgi:hypothetical protein
MNRPMNPRLHGPLRLAAGALAVMAIGGATYGWASIADVAPIVIVAIVGLYLWSARDSDSGALIRRQLDERLEHQRLQVQALVGRVLSLAVAVAYTIAVAAKATLWPWAILLGVMAVAFVGARLHYGERGSGDEE